MEKSMEAGAQDWVFSCGLCHPGGGSLEYDRNRDPYSAASPSGDRYYYKLPTLDDPVGHITANGVVGDPNELTVPFMDATNNVEIDCLMCHLNDGTGVPGNGIAFLNSLNCNSHVGGVSVPELAGIQLGPNNDPTCNTPVGAIDPVYRRMGAGMYPVGTKYDPANRIPAMQDKQLNLAASLAIGAEAHFSMAGDGHLHIDSIANVPATLNGGLISGTPASTSCAPCHARQDNTAGLPGMLNPVKYGYGLYLIMNPRGTVLDVDQGSMAVAPGIGNPGNQGYGVYPTVATGSNNVRWFEFGCVTGMGKRGQKTGKGYQDRWGLSLFACMFSTLPGADPGLMNICANPNSVGMTTTPGTADVYVTPFGPMTQPAKMPDFDVHDIDKTTLLPTGMACASCHFGIGAYNQNTAVNPTTDPIIWAASANINNSVTIPSTIEHNTFYPSQTYSGLDHHFAEADALKDNYGMYNLADTVSCEGCHINQNNPKLQLFGAAWRLKTTTGAWINMPVPTHSSFGAVATKHLDKIACTTCHIPEMYIYPFKLKTRDYTTGRYKRGTEAAGGFVNIYDFYYNFVTDSGDSIKQLHQWTEKYGETKIYPVTPSEIQNWISVINNWDVNFGSTATSAIHHTEPGTPTTDDTFNHFGVANNAYNDPTGAVNCYDPATGLGDAICTCQIGTRILLNCVTDADCTGYMTYPDPNMGAAPVSNACQPGNPVNVVPAMARDIMTVTTAALANASCQTNPGDPMCTVRINGGARAPVFNNWVLRDNFTMDTIAKRDIMRSQANALITAGTLDSSKNLQLVKIFHAPFDQTHGVTPKEWALGAPERGGCAMCHSSANNMQPCYSADSVGFFESLTPYVERANKFTPAPNAPMPDRLVPMMGSMLTGKYDLIKNPFAMFADFDCSNFFCGMNTCADAVCSTPSGLGDPNIYGQPGLDMFGSMLVTMGLIPRASALAMGMALTPDTFYFNQMTGDPIPGQACSATAPLIGYVNTIDDCTGMMHTGFDAMMGFPHAVVQNTCAAAPLTTCAIDTDCAPGDSCVGPSHCVGAGSSCGSDADCPPMDMCSSMSMGPAGMMGFHDGVRALQGSLFRETSSGTDFGCNPFPGVFHMAKGIGMIANFMGGADPTNGADMNRCVPRPSFMAPTSGWFGVDLPAGMLMAGTCTGSPSSDGMWPATCEGGFNNGHGCLPDINMKCAGPGNPFPCCNGAYPDPLNSCTDQMLFGQHVPAQDMIPGPWFDGMCLGAGNPWPCCGAPGGCTALGGIQNRDIDCIGSLDANETMFQFSRDPLGSMGALWFTRAQARSHHKVNLQSNGPLDLTWPIYADENVHNCEVGDPNPDCLTFTANPTKTRGWDQASRCLTNYDFMGPEVPCGTTGTGFCFGQDGNPAHDKCVNVKTYINSNDMLGYPTTGGNICTLAKSAGGQSLTNFNSMQQNLTCATCHAEVSYHSATNSATIKTPAAFDTNGCQTCHVGGIGASGIAVQTGNYEPHHSPAAPLATVDVANTCGYCHGTNGVNGTHNGAPAHTLAQLTGWAGQIHQGVVDLPPTISLGACSVNSCTGLATMSYTVHDTIDLNNLVVTWGTNPPSSISWPAVNDTDATGNVTHTYAANGAFAVTGTVTDSIGQTAVMNTTCTRVAPPNYSITVTVKNHAGTVNAASAKVTLTYSNGTQRSGYTGTNGQYTFGNVPDCTSYTIKVVKAGWTFAIPAASGTVSGANVSTTINAIAP